MWAIRDFAGRYFSEDGWTDRTRDALLYATCDEAERSMQENGIVDAYCSWAGGDMDWCATCVRWDEAAGRCSALPERPKDAVCVGYEYAGPGGHAAGGGQDKPAGSGGTARRICLNCSHYDPMGVKCQIMPSYNNFTAYDSSCERFSAKPDEPSQSAEHKTPSKLKKELDLRQASRRIPSLPPRLNRVHRRHPRSAHARGVPGVLQGQRHEIRLARAPQGRRRRPRQGARLRRIRRGG